MNSEFKLIKGAKVVNQGIISSSDVLIKGEIIHKISSEIIFRDNSSCIGLALPFNFATDLSLFSPTTRMSQYVLEFSSKAICPGCIKSKHPFVNPIFLPNPRHLMTWSMVFFSVSAANLSLVTFNPLDTVI